MVRVAPLADGRFNIMLRGVREYRVKEEVYDAGKLYRQFVVEWLRPERQPLASTLRQELNRLLDAYLQKNESVQKFLNDPTIEDEFFVNFFAFHLDLLPIEKQSLLEALSVTARATLLRDMLDFKLTEGRWAEGGGSANKPRLH